MSANLPIAFEGGLEPYDPKTNPDGGPNYIDGDVPGLPDWIPPIDSGRPSSGDINDLDTLPRHTVAAQNTVIPIVYGRDRLFARPFVVHIDETNGFLYVAYAVCEGRIEAFDKCIIDGIDVNEATEGFLLAPNSAIEYYAGTTTQTASPLLSAAISGYADACVGLVYVVIKAPVGSTRGFPRVEVIVRGRRIYDPRLDTSEGGSGSQSKTDPSTWTYSNNATLAFADAMYNFAGKTMDWQSVQLNATANDEMVGTEKRRTVGLTLADPATAEQWTKGFRVYMGAYVVNENGKIRIIPDKADVAAPGGILFNRDKTSGSYNRVTAAHHADVDMATGDFTLEAWIKPESIAAQGVVAAKYQNGTAARWLFGVDATARLYLTLGDGTNSATVNSPTSSLTLAVWQHVAVVVNQTANTAQFYVNGVASGTAQSFSAVTGSLSNASATLFFGSLSTTLNPFFGTVDEVRIWKAVQRTAQQLLDNKSKELVGNESGLELYYKCNQFSGTSVTDSGPNAITGTFANAPLWASGYAQVIPQFVARHFTSDLILKDSLRLSHRSLRSSPNSIIVEYLDDTSDNKWRRVPVQVDSPSILAGEPRRLSRISLPGIHRPSQARREATERLNWFLSDLEGSMTIFDEGLELQVGSIIAITHPIGLDGKLFRVTRIGGMAGRYNLNFIEYDPAIYSNEIIANPTIADTNLGNPLLAPTVTGLNAVEELFSLRNGITGSRIRITWAVSNNPFLSQYVVEGYVGGQLVFQTVTQGNVAVTPAVEELVVDQPVAYEVRVYAETAYVRGTAATTVVNIQGKLAPPGNVPSLSLQTIDANRVRLTWIEATDIDIWRYEIRRGTTSDTWEGLASTGVLDLVDGLTYDATNLTIGDHKFFIKARDSVFNESVTATTNVVTLSRPIPPPSFSLALEVGGEVRLRWLASTSPWVARYRVAYWNGSAEVTLDVVDTLRLISRDVPPGSWGFRVYAIDSAGNESTTYLGTTLNVTEDTNTFIADTYNFTTPSLTNMHSYDLRLDDKTYYVTNMNNVFVSGSPSDFSNQETGYLANYHASGNSEWLSETKDFGVALSGTWVLLMDLQSLSGVIDAKLELSPDNADWSNVTTVTVTAPNSLSQISTIAEGKRYARVRVNTTGTETSFVMAPTVKLQINVIPLAENGSSTSLSSGARVITTNRDYTFAKAIMINPQGTGALTGTYDNVIMGNPTTFDVYIFDIFGDQVVATFTWRFEGV